METYIQSLVKEMLTEHMAYSPSTHTMGIVSSLHDLCILYQPWVLKKDGNSFTQQSISFIKTFQYECRADHYLQKGSICLYSIEQ